MENLADDFKQAMRRHASAVTIITSGVGAQQCGMTATAVTSVAVDPPTLLIAVNQSASILPVLHDVRAFCVNLLSTSHKDLVAAFSGKRKGLDRFSTGSWRSSANGLPMLTDALANIVCEIKSTIDIETHTLFIGRVINIVNNPEIDPLLWIDGRFAGTTSTQVLSCPSVAAPSTSDHFRGHDQSGEQHRADPGG